MNKQLTDRLDKLIGVGKPKEVWAVYYKLNLIVFPSKKSSWASIGAAKKRYKELSLSCRRLENPPRRN